MRQPPFFYQEDLDQLQSDDPRFRGVVLIGGRGVGKSFFLRKVKEKLAESDDPLIEGRASNAADRLRKLLEGAELPACVLIDDLDHIFDFSGRDTRRAPWPTLRDLAPPPESRRRLFISFGARAFAHASLAEPSSPFLMQLHAWSLDPWRIGWQSRLERYVKDYLSRNTEPSVYNPQTHDQREVASTPNAGGILSYGGPYDLKGREDQEILDTFAKLLIEMTGGHPALFGEAIQLAAQFRAQQGVLPLRHHLEDHLLRTGLLKVRRAIVELRHSEDSGDLEAYQQLIRIARMSGDRERPVPPDIRAILLGSALIRWDQDAQHYIIPGELLQMDLQRSLLSTFEPLHLDLSPDLETPDQSGALVFSSPRGKSKIAVSGGPWKVIKILFERRGEPTPIKSIAKLCDMQSEAAARGVIQRLDSKITRAGLKGVIENEWGRGYRLGETPQRISDQ